MRYRLSVSGTVQGVGFRPFVYKAASELGLCGWVANSAHGVDIEVEGADFDCDAFIERLRVAAPPHAAIDDIAVTGILAAGDRTFEIRRSVPGARVTTAVSPDLATCSTCLAEVLDPANRRFQYPFTCCTQCGPRFSVIGSLPYERSRTSMKSFDLCPACAAEYEDPLDRRFHAEATACRECGPQLELWDGQGNTLATREAALAEGREALRCGLVLAVKGLGGFHLCVDARNEEAVQRLRARKRRPGKPFAVLFPSLEDIAACCELDDTESALIAGPEAPIVLLKRRSNDETGRARVANAVAPGSPCLGVMLPYTPVHHLLLHDLGFALVATSANLSDEPLVTDEQVACASLAGIADRFLVNDRPILRAVDDSVLRVVAGRPLILRRSRGLAPAPWPVPWPANGASQGAGDGATSGILALGGHLKTTVAMTTEKSIVLSQHLGTLSSPDSRGAHANAAADFSNLHGVETRIMACDMHPDYPTTQLALQSGLPVVQVQHHVAHVAACMAEHGLEGPVLGVAWDGTGFGADGTIWGGEFLLVERGGYSRLAHLRAFPLPGGERAVREPRRSAIGLLYARYGPAALERRDLAPIAAFEKSQLQVLGRALERGVNTPSTSSIGRLFDAVSSLAGLCQTASYEGEAAAMLEWALPDAPSPDCYEFAIVDENTKARTGWIVDWEPVVDALIDDAQAGRSAADLSAAFHNGLVRAILEVAGLAGQSKVILTGGCFQNAYLTAAAVDALQRNGFEPYRHERVPPNDGGLALGQAAYAGWQQKGAARCA
jgi:hydrogenase maturation protein HypF